jgi:hypothetical protein
MIMLTKVYKPNVKLMVEELDWNPNVWTLDEACVSSMANKTYMLWECKWIFLIAQKPYSFENFHKWLFH